MIPFEQLRSIVRRSTDDHDLVLETAACLALFGEVDAPDLVTASRQLLHHRPECIPLWWLCARVLAAPEPAVAARAVEREFRQDATANRLTGLLPFPHEESVAVLADAVVARAAVEDRPDLDAYAVRRTQRGTTRRRAAYAHDDLTTFDGQRPFGPRVSHVLFDALGGCGDRLLVPAGVGALLSEIGDADTVRWATLGAGRALPPRLFAAALAAIGDLDTLGLELLVTARCERIAGPSGLDPPERMQTRADCSVAPELLRVS